MIVGLDIVDPLFYVVKGYKGEKYKDIRVERMEGIIRWDALARINF